MTRIIQGLVFVTIALTVTSAIHVYLWVRLVRDTQLPWPWRPLATLGIILMAVSIPGTFFLSRILPQAWVKVVVFVPYVWMGMMMLYLFALLGADVVRTGLALFERLRSGTGMDPERRIFFARAAAGITSVAVAGLTAFSIRHAARQPIVKQVDVVLSKLPRAFQGYTIVQITDLHVGLTLGRAWLEQVVARVNALRPDLIAITGDVMDGSVERLRDDVAPLGALRASDGVYCVTGNHEYYSGVTRWIPELEALGIRVLRNTRVTLSRGGGHLDLAGVDDFNAKGMAPGHGPDMAMALADRPPDREVVLLAHQPRAVYEAATRDVGLVLSGHTHGGQIWPWHHFVGLQQPYRAGLHRHGPRTQVYVSEGTGYWGPPMRLGTTGEITRIVLHKERT